MAKVRLRFLFLLVSAFQISNLSVILRTPKSVLSTLVQIFMHQCFRPNAMQYYNKACLPDGKSRVAKSVGRVPHSRYLSTGGSVVNKTTSSPRCLRNVSVKWVMYSWSQVKYIPYSFSTWNIYKTNDINFTIRKKLFKRKLGDKQNSSANY